MPRFSGRRPRLDTPRLSLSPLGGVPPLVTRAEARLLAAAWAASIVALFVALVTS